MRHIAQDLGFSYFVDYDEQIVTKQREFRSACKFFSIDLTGKVVLDVGPGTADSLDCAVSLGASKTLFIDEEPFFVKFGEIKGHQGVQKNYTFTPFFPDEWSGRIDFIYTKGSINCEWVNEQHTLREAGDSKGYFDFEAWVIALQKLLKPSSGSIVLVPAMSMQYQRIIDEDYDLDTYYWCPDVAAYRNSYFVKTLVKRGFSVEDDIPGFTQKKAFPLAFYFSNQ